MSVPYIETSRYSIIYAVFLYIKLMDSDRTWEASSKILSHRITISYSFSFEKFLEYPSLISATMLPLYVSRKLWYSSSSRRSLNESWQPWRAAKFAWRILRV